MIGLPVDWPSTLRPRIGRFLKDQANDRTALLPNVDTSTTATGELLESGCGILPQFAYGTVRGANVLPPERITRSDALNNHPQMAAD